MATVQEPTRPASRHERFVQQELGRAVRRVRLLDVTKAGLGLAILVLAYGLVMMLADRWLNLPQSVRQGSLLGFLGLAALYTWFVLLAPIRRAVNPYYAAVQVEQTIPDAKNSLVNWLDLHDDNVPPGVVTAIAQRAAEDLKDTDVQQAIRSNGLAWLAGTTLGLIIGFFACFLIFRGDQFNSLLNRAYSPFGRDGGIVKQTRIAIVTPPEGNLTVAINRSVTITARVEGRVPQQDRPDAMRLLVRYNPDDPVYEERPLEPSAEGPSEWTLRLAPNQVRTGFWYKVAGGDDETPEYRVQVRSSPSITRFEVRHEYRSYLRWEPRVTDDPNIEDWRGTEITLVAFTNRRVREGKLLLESEGKHRAVEAQLLPERPELMRFRFTLEKDAKYRIWFTTADDESNNDPLPYTVHVLQDQPPTVELTRPEPEITLAADAVHRVEGRAVDDFGIRKVTLRMTLGDQVLRPKEYLSEPRFRLDTGGYMRLVNYQDHLDLTKLETARGLPVELKTGDVLEYWLEAQDNCDFPGPQVGSSRRYKVKIAPPRVDENQRPKNEDEQKQLDAKKDERDKERKQAGAEKQQQEQKHEQDRQQQGEQDRKDQEERKEKTAQEERDRQEKQNKQQGGQAQKPDQANDSKEPQKTDGEPKKSGDEQSPTENKNDARNDRDQGEDRKEPNKADDKSDEKAGEKPNTGGKNDKDADAKPSDKKQDGGSDAGDKKDEPQQGAAPRNDDKKDGGSSTSPDGTGKGDRPPQAGADKGMSDTKNPPKPAAGTPMDKAGSGTQPDKSAKPNEPGRAPGNPQDQPPHADKAGNMNDPAKAPQDKKPGDGGRGADKNDHQPQTGAPDKDASQKNDGSARRPGDKPPQPMAGDAKPMDRPPMNDAGPNKAPQNDAGKPQGSQKPGAAGDPMNADKGTDTKPMPNNPMGQGSDAKEDGQPDQGSGGRDERAGAGGKDDTARTEDQRKSDAKVRDAVKQALNHVARNDPEPKKRQAAEQALKDLDKAQRGDQGAPNTTPQQPRAGDPQDDRQSPAAKANDPTKESGRPGAEKRADKGEPNAGKGQPMGAEPPRGRPQDADAAAGKGADQSGKPMNGGKPGDADAAKPGKSNESPMADKGSGTPGAGGKGEPMAAPDAKGPMADKDTPKKNEPAAQPDKSPADQGKPAEPGGRDDGSAAPGAAQKPDDRPGRQPGNNPGLNRDPTAPGDAGPPTPPDVKPTKPNEDYKNRSGELTLEDLDRNKLKELFQKHNMTKEEEERFYAELAKSGVKTPKAPGAKDLQAAQRRGTGLNTGPRRVSTPNEKDPSALLSGSTGQAPPEYRKAAEKFAELLNKASESKPK